MKDGFAEGYLVELGEFVGIFVSRRHFTDFRKYIQEDYGSIIRISRRNILNVS